MRHSEHDKKIAQIIKEQLPEAPKDEWFVKKTMNRLPEKRRPLFSKAEIICYIISAIIIIAGWGWQISSIYMSEVVTLANIIISTALFFSALMLLASIAAPIIKRS